MTSVSAPTVAAGRADGTESVVAITATPVRVPPPSVNPAATELQRPSTLVAVELHLTSGAVGKALARARDRSASQLAAELTEIGETFAGSPLDELVSSLSSRRGFRLVSDAVAVLDMATWDARARNAGVPLYQMFGSVRRPLRAYGVVDRRDVEGMVAAATALRERGMGGIELKLGHQPLEVDLRVLEAVRREVGTGVDLMVDYQQSLTVAEARVRGRALEEVGLIWIKDPIEWRDFLGLRTLVADLTTPIQTGRHYRTGADVRAALDVVGSELLVLDAQSIGGVTAWIQQARVAARREVSVSSHLWSELSAHLLATSLYPGWLQRVESFIPLSDPVLSFRDGWADLADVPGSGIDWHPGSLERFRI